MEINEKTLKELDFRYVDSPAGSYETGWYTKAYVATTVEIIKIRELLKVSPTADVCFCNYVTIRSTHSQIDDIFSKKIEILFHKKSYSPFNGQSLFIGYIHTIEELETLLKQLGIDG